MNDNPLLDFSSLPRFDTIAPEHVRPAITELLESGRALVERLTGATVAATWNDFAQTASNTCRAPGASSVTCIRSMTSRPGARPTTTCCRK
jgi:Zn-dependent oligopeptidase